MTEFYCGDDGAIYGDVNAHIRLRHYADFAVHLVGYAASVWAYCLEHAWNPIRRRLRRCLQYTDLHGALLVVLPRKQREHDGRHLAILHFPGTCSMQAYLLHLFNGCFIVTQWKGRTHDPDHLPFARSRQCLRSLQIQEQSSMAAQ